MFEARALAADHKDLIHDITFDYYGRRMATCSSDQSVKVWDLNESGEWVCTSSWKTHSGSVWRVVWAHPEFGQVLATCSFDRTACIWEEQIADSSISPNAARSAGSHWVKRATLVDSRTSVTDIAFAPKHLGLHLATCSTDGYVRIYEAPDVMNLSQWTLMHEISCKNGCSCITWNPSRSHPPMIAVGIDSSSSSGLLQIFELNDSLRRWQRIENIVSISDPVHDVAFAPNLGRSFHTLAVASKDVRIFTLSPSRDASASYSKLDVRQPAQFEESASQVWRVEWNVTGTILASAGDDGCVRMYKANHLDNWKCIKVLKGDLSEAQATAGSAVAPGSTQPIRDTPVWLSDVQQL
ncbi:nucleoporin SEH1-like [Sycon ciliatum]|uniref:nucleoporin SEH1-like n=1 Tax=Sycon ciliatum TaxID=27933 RepID=UPI0020AB9D7A|eukprot:scpid60512/ scgid8265/ Nucleoporin seh1; Nup107-160 subcomplex subunit seh1